MKSAIAENAPHVEPEPDKVQLVESSAPKPSSARKAKATPQAVPDAAVAGKRVATSLSLPVSLVAQLRERSRRDRQPIPQVIIDALVATRGRHRDMVAERAREWGMPVADEDGFVRTVRAADPEGVAILSVRMLAANLEHVDRLTAESGAPSRSKLVSAALSEYLE